MNFVAIVTRCLPALLGLGWASMLSAQVAPGTITPTQITGQVVRVDPQTGVETRIRADMTLRAGSVIKTGADSTVALIFSNGSALVVNPESEVEITQYDQTDFDPKAYLDETREPSVSQTTLTVRHGTVVGDVRPLNIDQGSHYHIYSPNLEGHVEIKGTTFAFQIDLSTGNLTITTDEGLVYYVNTAGQFAQIPAGMTVTTAGRDPQVTASLQPIRDGGANTMLLVLRNALIAASSGRLTVQNTVYQAVSRTSVQEGNIITGSSTFEVPNDNIVVSPSS